MTARLNVRLSLALLGVAASALGAVALGVLIAALPGADGLMVALALVTAAGLTLATIHNPAIGGYVLIAAVPIISGLKSGVPIPGFRPSEILIGGSPRSFWS